MSEQQNNIQINKKQLKSTLINPFLSKSINNTNNQNICSHNLISENITPSTFILKNGEIIKSETKKLNLTPISNNKLNNLFQQIKSEIKIPLNKVNDEKFKLLAIRNSKSPLHKPNKSLRKSDFIKRCDINDINNNDDINSVIMSAKRKSVILPIPGKQSAKKIYHRVIELKNNNSAMKFNLFKDSQIGLSKEWQEHTNEIDQMYKDEDVESEIDEINKAEQRNINNLKAAIKYIELTGEFISENDENIYFKYNNK